MERIIEFRDGRGSSPYLIKIRVDAGFFSKYLDLLDIVFLNSLANEPVNRKEDLFIYLKPLYKNSKDNCCKKKARPLNVFLNKTYRRFSFSTPYGSFIKGDFAKGYAEGKIWDQDIYKRRLLRFLIKYCFLYNFSTRIHAAWVTTGNNSFLLAGHQGVGKSTLCRLLKGVKEYRILHDDRCFIISTPENSYVHSLAPEKPVKDASFEILPCTSIFFIKLSKIQESKIYPLSKKEAFSRIVFLSEFPDYEDTKQKERRIENLSRLVNRCECFLLINGNDLKRNPERLINSLPPPLFNY